MNRQAFIRTLRRLTRQYARTDGRSGISPDEAADLLRLFDAGRLSENDMPSESTGMSVTAVAAIAGLLAALRRVGAVPASSTPRTAYSAFQGLSEAARERTYRRIIEAFHRDMAMQTGRVVPYQTSLRLWHQGMSQRVSEDMMAMAQLGKGGALSAAEREALQRTLTQQQAYLRRFADEVMAREAVGRPMSERSVISRARMYSGEPQAVFWRLSTGRLGDGYVLWFEGRDEGGTCQPCRDAMNGSPYLAANAPMPGVVCRGGGHCRHRLRAEFNPGRYAELTNQRRAA